jgi:L-ascorbate metabolism protein UlaG (beta-lactamase superfamily)
MNIKFLGTGGAFDFEKGTAAAIVNVAGKNILIDCGFSTILKLVERDLVKDIDYILVTHLHGDHVGSLPTLLAYIFHKLGKDVPKIIVPNGQFQTEIQTYLEATYEGKRGSYISIEEFPEIGYIETSGQHVEGMTSFSYYFVEDNHLIYYSGDIGNADVAKNFLDTRTETNIQVFHETSPRTDITVHASYIEVQEKLSDYETYVYHIAKENMPDDCTLTYIEDCPELLF